MTSHIRRPLIASLLLLCLALRNAPAQTPGALEQVDAVQQRHALEASTQFQHQSGDTAPEIFPGESQDVGPQSVLKIKPRRQWVDATADSQYFYSDNAFLAHDNPQRSGLLASTVQIALAPTPYQLGSGLSAPRLGFRQQWFNFFEYQSHSPSFDTADFNVQTIFIDERWQHEQWFIGAGLDYTRLLTASTYDQFYSEFVPRWEAQRIVPLCPQSALAFSYEGFYHFTDASGSLFLQPQNSFDDRLDQVIQVSLNFNPCSHVVVQPYYRFKYTHFTSNVDRNDDLHSVGLGLYCFFNQRLSARAFVNYDRRNSTDTLAEYRQFNAGGGLNFTLRF
ncbi:MAG: hypothetical protein JWR19_2795 [Pedosphaera sp.]|nr:hypothetical protein [Pedosphaera sp.]